MKLSDWNIGLELVSFESMSYRDIAKNKDEIR